MLKFNMKSPQVVCCRICNHILALKNHGGGEYYFLLSQSIEDHYKFIHKIKYRAETSHYYG